MTITRMKPSDIPRTSPDFIETINGLIDNEELQSNIAKYAPIFHSVTDSRFSYSVLIGSATITEEVAPNGQMGLKVVTSVETTLEIESLEGQFFMGSVDISTYGTNTLGNVQKVRFNAYESVSGADRIFADLTFEAAPENTNREQGGALTIHFDEANTGKIGTPADTFKIDRFDFRITPLSGETATMWIFGFGVNTPTRKSRLCVVFDDGYSSSLDLGTPPFARRNIKTTTAIIATHVDSNPLYSSLDNLKAYVNSGNAVVAHGPIGGTGDLIENYEFAADPVQSAIDDILFNIKYVEDNNLSSINAPRCYVYPRGKYQRFVNDTALLDKMLENNIVTARCALPTAANRVSSMDSAGKYARLTMPHIGHNWSGSTANEVANIANIKSLINEISTSGGMDFYLMLHLVVPDSTIDANMTISIRESDLEDIVVTIAANIDAGLLDVVTMPEFVADDTVWSRY